MNRPYEVLLYDTKSLTSPNVGYRVASLVGRALAGVARTWPSFTVRDGSERLQGMAQNVKPSDSEKEKKMNLTFRIIMTLINYPPWITYYWTVPLILDHSYLVGKLTSLKIADTKV
jgi:hypothetical protein